LLAQKKSGVAGDKSRCKLPAHPEEEANKQKLPQRGEQKKTNLYLTMLARASILIA
jgi:hypothetical protein